MTDEWHLCYIPSHVSDFSPDQKHHAPIRPGERNQDAHCGQGEGPIIVLAHGWPELWYSWRHVLPVLAAAGYHAVAPDMRGYGQTDAPPNILDYTHLQLVGDVVLS
jgi:pimeloyl-ACP methyl ester carboxylesterase